MSLLFGKLTNQFVDFGTAVSNLDPNNPASVDTFERTAADFRSGAARNALYLTVIGLSFPLDRGRPLPVPVPIL